MNNIAIQTTYTCPTYLVLSLEVAIKLNTTVAELDEFFSEFAEYEADCGKDFALHKAVKVGNTKLIEYIVKISKTNLFLFLDEIELPSSFTPLHSACQHINPEIGYLVTKKLLQLGSPVNIFMAKPINFVKSIKTPLDCALKKGNLKIAALLIRQGGFRNMSIPSSQANNESYTKAKNLAFEKEITYINCFKNTSASHQLPKEILYGILSFSLKTDLQD